MDLGAGRWTCSLLCQVDSNHATQMRCEHRSKSLDIDFASLSVLPNEKKMKQTKNKIMLIVL